MISWADFPGRSFERRWDKFLINNDSIDASFYSDLSLHDIVLSQKIPQIDLINKNLVNTQSSTLMTIKDGLPCLTIRAGTARLPGRSFTISINSETDLKL